MQKKPERVSTDVGEQKNKQENNTYCCFKGIKEVTWSPFKGGFTGIQTLDQRYTLSLLESEAIY